MPRPMSPAFLAAITSQYIQPALFVELTFSNEILYVWSGVGSITWNGQVWVGVGTFGSITAIEEGTSLDARGMTFTLSGINQQALADALQNIQIALPVILYIGMFNGSGSLIADPIIAWQGRMDQPIISVGGDTVTISLQAESRLLDMDIAVDRRYTLDDSQIDDPGDLGFQFCTSIFQITILWGQSWSAINNL